MTGRLRKLASLALACTAALFALALPAGAAPSDGAASSDGAAAIEPVAPSSAYSPTLNNQLTTFNRQLAELPTQQSLDGQQADLDRRTSAYNEQSKAVLDALDANDEKIRQHNEVVAQYPNGAPPSVADALNAEADAINSEQKQLKDKANKIADEGEAIKSGQADLDKRKGELDSKRSTLQSARGYLVDQMATELLARLATPPAATHPGTAVDRARPAVTATRTDGGDRASGALRRGPFDSYAGRHGVTVDPRPVDAVLSPGALTKFAMANAGTAGPTRRFDALATQGDGTYRGLSLRDPSRPPTAAERAFDDTLNTGGAAVTLVNGKRAVISGTDEVEAPTPASAVPPPRNLALGLAGRVQPFAERYGYEHLMDLTKAQLRRELIGRLEDPNYRIHVSLKDLSKADLPNVLARGRAYEDGMRTFPFDANGRIPAYAATWERAPGVTDWEMYLIHTLPGVLERTTFYDENDNAVPDPF
ncbi:hypothetical protein ACFYS8_18330 [Kitasatospora sp. NPDC004615]|uniref:hypothetical protein n=1 Tax=Kitasatospora sp. NPDC004615 TaxID=3364017 RepID=UPI0036946C85